MEEPIALLLRECTTCTHARLSSLNNRRFAFFSQTSEGEDGPTETDGQREHHHRHGKGERTGNLLRAEEEREGGRRKEESERASERGSMERKIAQVLRRFFPPYIVDMDMRELRVAATRQPARPDYDRAYAPLFYLIEH